MSLRRGQASELLHSISFRPSQKRTILTKRLPDIGFSVGEGTHVVVIDSGVNNDVTVDERYDLTGFGTADGITQTHGTLVAAIIRHFAKRAHITSIKVTQTRDNIDWNKVFKALQQAKQLGADLVNLSIGHHNPIHPCRGKCTICNEFQAFIQQTGIIVVASAGNSGDNDETVNSPAVAPDVVAVGMVDDTGRQVDPISSRGTPGMVKPNLLTSGHVVRNGSLQFGTSFAAPVVTGLLAAALPTYASDRTHLVNTLYSSCEPIEGVHRHHQGHGVLKIESFVEVIRREKSNANSQGQKPN